MSIHLTKYHDEVQSFIMNEMAWLQSFTAYPEVATELKTPCAFFQIEDFEISDVQKMNGTLSVDLSCEIIVVLGINNPFNQVEVRNAALALAIKVQGCRFGLPCVGAKFISASPDSLNEELDGYAAWSIKYSHQIEAGDDKYEPNFENITPHTVYVGFCPEIGRVHQDDYEQIVPINKIEPR